MTTHLQSKIVLILKKVKVIVVIVVIVVNVVIPLQFFYNLLISLKNKIECVDKNRFLKL